MVLWDAAGLTAARTSARSLVRAALKDAGVAQKIDALVAKLLDGG